MQSTQLDVIEGFSGPFRFLSNFHETPFAWEGRTASTAEHHYNAARTDDPAQKARIYAQETPGRAKREGHAVSPRKGWDDHLKGGYMESILQAKFAPGTALSQRLLDTQDALLIEKNNWHDQYWGQCTCERHYHWPGANVLGRLLMRQRETLRERSPSLTRVGITGHRSQSLSPAEAAWADDTLPRLMRSLRDDHGAQVAISGMSLGTDITWARSAVAHDLRLWGYVPSPDQSARWTPDNQALHTDLLMRSSRLVALGRSYDPRWLRARNELIVRDSNVLISVDKDGKASAGAAIARKARACDARLIRVNVTRREVVAATQEGEVPWVF